MRSMRMHEGRWHPRRSARVKMELELEAARRELLPLARRFAKGDVWEAEDLLQETMLIGLRLLRERSLAGALAPWLVAVLRNQARARRRERMRDLRARERIPLKESEDPVCDASREELRTEFLIAAGMLPPIYSEVFALYLRGRTRPVEIARHLNLPESTVRTRLERGKAMLRVRMSGWGTWESE